MIQEIAAFLKSKEKLTYVNYRGKRRNSACEWHKLRSPLLMVMRAACNELLRHLVLPSGFKNQCYRMLGVKVGKDVVIGPLVWLDPLFPELITLEDGVMLGSGVLISTHEFLGKKIRLGRVTIRENAIVGVKSSILSGCEIGRESVLGFMSYICKDIPAKQFWGGVPARCTKELENDD